MKQISGEKIIAINLASRFWTCKAFLPGMISAGKGHVVNMASAGVFWPCPPFRPIVPVNSGWSVLQTPFARKWRK